MKPSPALDATSSRLFDLPPKWDGHPVTWDGWTVEPPVRIYPPPPQTLCPGCDTASVAHTNRGHVTPTLILHGTGHGRTASGWDLVAMRCPHCHHDQVIELRDSFNVWDLDDNDYTPEGSWA